MLAYPDLDEPYIIDMDASNLAISAVLSQVKNSEEKVIMYGSKAFFRVTMMLVYNEERTFCYNSFCNSEILLLHVESGIHSLD